MRRRAPPLTLTLVLLAGAAVPGAWAEDRPEKTHASDVDAPVVVFVGVTVHDGAGGVAENRQVLAADGSVKAITDLADVPGARRISVKGAHLTPGLIDAASRAGYRHAEAEVTRELTALVDAADLADLRHRDFREAARNGCTTVMLVPGPRNVVGGTGRAIGTWSASRRAEPLAVGHRPLHVSISTEASSGNFPPRYGATSSIYARRPNTRMGVIWLLRQAFLSAKGVQSIPGEPDLTPYREVLDGKRPCRVFGHRGQDADAALRLAKEAGFTFTLEGAEEAYLLRERLAEAGIPVILGPAPHETSGAGPDYTDTALRSAVLLRDAGVRLALTAGNLGGYWLREQMTAAVHHGLGEEEALAAVTGTAADLCGLDDRGRVQVGKAADLVLWSAHPASPTARALLVMRGGRIVFDETAPPETEKTR